MKPANDPRSLRGDPDRKQKLQRPHDNDARISSFTSELPAALRPVAGGFCSPCDLTYADYSYYDYWVEFHRSAGRHGVGPGEVLHAVEHALVIVDMDPDADPPKVLVIGPRSDGQLLEVIILTLANDRHLVIHAMALRPTFHDLLPEGASDMTTPPTKPYVTPTGRVLSDADIEALADEVAGDIDVATLTPRRRGRPPLVGGPADVVPVRLDANLRAAVETRATNDHTTTSDVIREALRRYLDVA